MAVSVFAADEQTDHPVELPRWARLAEQVLEAEGVDVDAEVGLVFLDEKAISKLNEQYHGGKGPTDVLSFPIDDEPRESGRHPDSGGSGPGEPVSPDDVPVLLGDVYVCPAVAARNAPAHAGDEHGGTYEDEVALLVVHGLLHLLGMDHDDDDHAHEMEAREQVHLDRFHRQAAGADTGPLPPRRSREQPSRGPWLPPRSPSSLTLDRLRSLEALENLAHLESLDGIDDGDPPDDQPPQAPPDGGAR